MSALTTAPPTRAAPARAIGLGGAAVVVVAIAAWALTGVGASELLRYAAYQAAFVFAPGLLVYLALASRPGDPIRVLTLAWTLGLALEVGAFAATSAVGVPALFLAYPVLALAALPAARRHAAGVDWTEAPSPGVIAAGAGVVAVAVLYLAIGPFVDAPLPEDAASVSYYVDNVFDISLVAEAVHHWPLANPSVAGEPLRYHLFAFLEMGGTARVTGVEPATLVLRLFPLSITVLSILHMACLGRRLSARWTVGVLAAGLLFLTGEFDLDPRDMFPFAGTFAFATFASPTFLFALPFFLGATLLLCDLIERDTRTTPAEWTLLAAMVILAVGAKASAVPVLLGGLVLLAGWCVFRCRDRLPRLAALIAVLSAIFLVAYAGLYSGGEGALAVRLFDFLRITVVGDHIPAWQDHVLLGAVLTPPTLVGMCVALLGVAWFWPFTRAPLTVIFLLALFLASIVPSVIVEGPGASQLYFLLYGIPAAVVVAAAGLARGWTWAAESGVRARPPAIAAAACVAVALAGAAWVWGRPETAATRSLALVYLVVLALVATAALVLAPRRRALGFAAIASALLIAVAAADRPVDILPTQLQAVADGLPAHPLDIPSARGTTRPLTEGLRWVRDNTPADALLAVNVHFRNGATDSRYFYYSALAERRVFLESWSYTPEGAAENAPESVFPARLAVNDGAILRADPGDLDQLRRRGVDYIVADRIHGTAAPALDGALTRVFSNDAVTVYRL